MGKDNKKRRKQKKRLKKRRIKNRNSKKLNKSKKILGPVYVQMKSPLSDITVEQRRKILDEIGEKSQKEFTDSLEKIRTIIKNHDPIGIISIISGYSLTVGASDTKGVKSNEDADSIHQFHVEILQALILQIKIDGLGDEPVTPAIIQSVLDELKILARSFTYSRFNSEVIKDSEEKQAIHQIQELVRSHTQAVRNWGYFSQVKSISREIYSFFDSKLANDVGVTPTKIIKLFDFILLETERLLTKRHNDLSNIRRTEFTKDQYYKYADLIGQDRNDIDYLLKNTEHPKKANENTFAMLLAHYDLSMKNYYTFYISEVATSVGLSEHEVKIVFENFSLSLGDLENYNTEFIFLDNPIWNNPLIKLDEEKFLCPIPQVFFSFILLSLDTFIEKIDKKALSKRRAVYLEEKIEEIVKRRFPSALTVSGVKWDYEGSTYETDLITFIDSHAIIIEAKSHKITKPALRGAPDRIKRHIREIIIDPSVQSRRFEKHLINICNGSTVDDKLQEQLPVDLSEIKKIIRVSVSLEDFSTLQANVSQLDNTGWIPQDFEPCPSMNLADFESLFDLLEHPVQIIHYLTQRANLQGKIDFLGDELDFMGLYLTTLLNMGDLHEENPSQVMISQMSTPIDHYYNSKDQGIVVPKPQPKVSKLFRNIFIKLEKRSTPRWTEIGVLLNMLTPDDQVKLEKHIRQYTKVVHRTWKNENHKNTLVFIPPSSSDFALAFLMYKNENANQRNEFIQNALALGLEADHVKNCLVIASNIDDSSLPYHFIALGEANT